MLSSFTWYANNQFTVNDGEINKNKIFLKNNLKCSKLLFFFFCIRDQSFSPDMQNIIPPTIMQKWKVKTQFFENLA